MFSQEIYIAYDRSKQKIFCIRTSLLISEKPVRILNLGDYLVQAKSPNGLLGSLLDYLREGRGFDSLHTLVCDRMVDVTQFLYN